MIAGAYIKVTKDVTRGDALPEIFPFQVTKATKVPSKRTTQNERAALASLKEKVTVLHRVHAIRGTCRL